MKKKNIKDSKNKERKVLDKTQVYKIKKRRKPMNPKTKKLIKKIIIIFSVLLLICSGIIFAVVYGIIKEAKLSMADLAIKNQNSIVKDISREYNCCIKW